MNEPSEEEKQDRDDRFRKAANKHVLKRNIRKLKKKKGKVYRNWKKQIEAMSS